MQIFSRFYGYFAVLGALGLFSGLARAAVGPQLVKDINPFSDQIGPYLLENVNGTLIFIAGSEDVWKSDGTEAGTVMVKDMTDFGYALDKGMTAGNLYFFTTNSTIGKSTLWRSDGTEAGTFKIKDISASNLTDINGELFFYVYKGSNVYELWKSNGTEAGTVKIKTINTGSGNMTPGNFTDVNGTLFFTINMQLWKSDGTEAGTKMVKDFLPGSYDPFFLGLQRLTNVNGTLFFRGYDTNTGYELWKSNGTEAGTVRVKDIDPDNNDSSLWFFHIYDLTDVNGVLFFNAHDGSSGTELWKSDGTAAGTVRVKDINPGPDGSYETFTKSVALNGLLYFVANDGTSGDELWRSDGTAAGTVRVKDINPGSSNSGIDFFTSVGGALFFIADNGSAGLELWQSNGTEAGTFMVQDIIPNNADDPYEYPYALTSVNGTLFFAADDGNTGYELWKLQVGLINPTDFIYIPLVVK